MFFKKKKTEYLKRFRDEVARALGELGVTMGNKEGSSWTTSEKPFVHAQIILELREREIGALGCWVEILADRHTFSGVIPSDVPLIYANRPYPYLALCVINGSDEKEWPLSKAAEVAQRLFDQATRVEAANMKAREPEFLRRCEEAQQAHRRAYETERQLATEVSALLR